LLNHSAVAELAEIPNESVSVDFDEGVLIFIVNVEGQTAPKIFQAHPLLHLSDYWEDGDNRFGPMRYNELRREYADRLWSLLTARLQAEILLGRRTIVARLATPLAEEFTAIPSDVWEHFSVTDWWRGVATSAAGERLYSIHLLPGAADPSSPADTSLWLAQMRSEKVAPPRPHGELARAVRDRG
jgi:hypothetical protein